MTFFLILAAILYALTVAFVGVACYALLQSAGTWERASVPRLIATAVFWPLSLGYVAARVLGDVAGSLYRAMQEGDNARGGYPGPKHPKPPTSAQKPTPHPRPYRRL